MRLRPMNGEDLLAAPEVPAALVWPQGEWLCPSCSAGRPLPPPEAPRTLREKYLAGTCGIDIVIIEDARTDDSTAETMVSGRWFARPEDTCSGRQVTSVIFAPPSNEHGECTRQTSCSSHTLTLPCWMGFQRCCGGHFYWEWRLQNYEIRLVSLASNQAAGGGEMAVQRCGFASPSCAAVVPV
jgi:hypothetical protein